MLAGNPLTETPVRLTSCGKTAKLSAVCQRPCPPPGGERMASANAMKREVAGWRSARFGADRANTGVSGVGRVRAIREISELDELFQTPVSIDSTP